MSQIVVHGDTVYLAGIVADTTKDKSVREQTTEILAQIDKYLAQVGSDKTKILSAQIFLADISTFADMNIAWDVWVPKGHTPARATTGGQARGSALQGRDHGDCREVNLAASS